MRLCHIQGNTPALGRTSLGSAYHSQGFVCRPETHDGRSNWSQPKHLSQGHHTSFMITYRSTDYVTMDDELLPLSEHGLIHQTYVLLLPPSYNECRCKPLLCRSTKLLGTKLDSPRSDHMQLVCMGIFCDFQLLSDPSHHLEAHPNCQGLMPVIGSLSSAQNLL